MFVLVIATIVVIGSLAACGLVTLIVLGLSLGKKRKARRHALLGDSTRRLKTVVAELLEKLNDLDQQSKFSGIQNDGAYKDRLAVSAKDLVTVTDTLPAIEQLLNEERFNDAADLLSATCRLVEKIVRVMAQLEPGLEQRYKMLEGGTTVKLEEKRFVGEKKAEE